jgi:hypothetical protein
MFEGKLLSVGFEKNWFEAYIEFGCGKGYFEYFYMELFNY